MSVIIMLFFEFIIMTLVKVEDELLVSFILILFSLLNCIAIKADPKLNAAKKQLYLGMFLRLALLFFDRYGKAIMPLPNSGADSEGFYRNCLEFVRNGSAARSNAFVTTIGTIMRYVGTSRTNAPYIVIAFSLISLVVITYTLREIDVDDSIKEKVMWIVSLLPNFAILGAIFFT